MNEQTVIEFAVRVAANVTVSVATFPLVLFAVWAFVRVCQDWASFPAITTRQLVALAIGVQLFGGLGRG